ncbi:MAG: hypothetical protein ACRD2U_15275 [Terriglobales bacterium]
MATQFSAGRRLLFAGLGIAMLAVIWSSVRMSGKMQSGAEGVTQDEFSQQPPGTKTKLVLEVSHASSGEIDGHLLESNGKNSYSRTAVTVQVIFGADTKIVMGNASDIHAGAVIHVAGNLTQTRAIHAQQLVVLTGYVDVK